MDHFTVPYDGAVSGSAAAGRVEVAVWTDGVRARLRYPGVTLVLKGLNPNQPENTPADQLEQCAFAPTVATTKRAQARHEPTYLATDE